MGLRVPLPGLKIRRPWAEQMGLEKLSEDMFRSTAGAPYGGFFDRNGEQRPRAFGGHVYAQAVYAASKTVDAGFFVHSVTGYFTILALADEPFTYHVQSIREGKNYSVKRVDVWQEDRKVCFSNICSFKKTEHQFLQIQKPEAMEEKYAGLLGGKKVEDLPLEVNIKDVRSAFETKEASITSSLAGMYISVLPLKRLHEQQTPIDRKNFSIYSTISEATSDQDPNLAACAHLYHSDRESVWSILRQYELLDVLDSAASLSHTVIFHVGAEQLKFHDANGRRWFFLEAWSKRVSDGRGLHEGRIYDRDGNHVASTMQDGAIRLSFGSEDEKKTREESIRRRSNL